MLNLLRVPLPFPKKVFQQRKSSLNFTNYGTVKKLVRVNKQNRFEVPIARKLGAKLTHGSGSINSDADMRIPGYLIEHKSRAGDRISLSYDIFEKIRRQANQRNLSPALIVSSPDHPTDDLVVMSVGDAYDLYADRFIMHRNPVEKRQKQINICFPDFITEWMKSPKFIHIQLLQFPTRPDLIVSHIKDFKRCIKVA
jgi:hypothetical protein